MAKDKTPGIILYPEDIERIKRSVKPEHQFDVIYALAQFATTGELPTEADLGEGGMVAFEFIFDKVNEGLEKFRQNQQQRKDAIAARWQKETETHQEDTDEYDRIRPNTDEYETVRKSSKQKQKLKTETESINVKPKEEAVVVKTAAPADDRIIAFDGTDLTEDIKRYDLADSMIRTYGMVDSDQTRNALIEDLEKVGEKKLRDVLKEAALSNSRSKVSVKFYRAVLEGKGGKSRAAPDYMKRQYDDDHWKSIEVNLDAG